MSPTEWKTLFAFGAVSVLAGMYDRRIGVTLAGVLLAVTVFTHPKALSSLTSIGS